MSIIEIKKQAFLDLLEQVGVDVVITPYSPRPQKPLKAHRLTTLNDVTYQTFESLEAKRIYRVLSSEINFSLRHSMLSVADDEFKIVHSHPQDDDNVVILIYVE